MTIDPTSSQHPFGLPAVPPTAGARGAEAGEFARVFELHDARSRRAAAADPLPDHVLADISRAAELVDRLAATGRHVSFGTHDLTGAIVADLVDEDGGTIRRLPLVDVVAGFDPDVA